MHIFKKVNLLYLGQPENDQIGRKMFFKIKITIPSWKKIYIPSSLIMDKEMS